MRNVVQQCYHKWSFHPSMLQRAHKECKSVEILNTSFCVVLMITENNPNKRQQICTSVYEEEPPKSRVPFVFLYCDMPGPPHICISIVNFSCKDLSFLTHYHVGHSRVKCGKTTLSPSHVLMPPFTGAPLVAGCDNILSCASEVGSSVKTTSTSSRQYGPRNLSP